MRQLASFGDLALVRKSELAELRRQLDEVYGNRAPPLPSPPLPPGAQEELRPDHPLLVVQHPIGTVKLDEVNKRAEAAFDKLVDILLAPEAVATKVA